MKGGSRIEFTSPLITKLNSYPTSIYDGKEFGSFDFDLSAGDTHSVKEQCCIMKDIKSDWSGQILNANLSQ